MRIAGIVLIVLGAIVLLMQGISYTQRRDEVRVGPLSVAAEERGFIPPIAGALAIGAGVLLMIAGGRRR